MLIKSPTMQASGSTSSDRWFIYEVEGLQQNDRTDNNSYPLRNSGSTFIAVPRNRMNQEMRRITSMGGRIKKIQSL